MGNDDERRNKPNSDEDSIPTISGGGTPQGNLNGASDLVGSQIGPYKLLRVLGEGGYGIVYLAQQDEPIKRQVALKIIKPSMDSRQIITRFEAERQALALLDHPNIARVLDAGTTEGERPYFVMEYVKGNSIIEYCEQQKLSIKQRIELFGQVCEALHHAHQKGIIHRDLKPSNILISSKGSRVIPKIIDFGIAKALSEPLTEHTLLTEEGQLLGTPAYMSPEQAAGLHDQLDTRTDVYSLGVVLYKALTGSFPYDVNSAILQTLRNIQEAEPVRPSKLVSPLDSDIEAIILKTLAKRPEDRYQSVAELHHDIEQWLKGLPIMAKSDSSLYLLRKIVTRHRYTSTVVALLTVIVLSFSAISLHLSLRLRKAADPNAYIEPERMYVQLLRHGAIATVFLPAWHGDDLQEAKKIALFFEPGTNEHEALRFLLDPKPLEDKIGQFRKKSQERDPALAAFVIAEHYLKDGNEAAAVESYRKCLVFKGEQNSEIWIIDKARSRLHEISKAGQKPQSRSALEDRESRP